MDLLVPVCLKNVPMEYEAYCEKVAAEQRSAMDWMSSPGARWHVPDSLRAKVNDRGVFRLFFGDTVVMPLKETALLGEIQARLCGRIPDVCAEPLHKGFFHITLHDLTSGRYLAEIQPEMNKNEETCREIFRETAAWFTTHPDHAQVCLRAARVYPSVNVSLVLGFLPVTERDYRIIMNLYNLFDRVVYLPYWLRLHVTLSYFRPQELSMEQMGALCRALQEFSPGDMEVRIDLRDIQYQYFSSMNHYRTHFCLRDFMEGQRYF